MKRKIEISFETADDKVVKELLTTLCTEIEEQFPELKDKFFIKVLEKKV